MSLESTLLALGVPVSTQGTTWLLGQHEKNADNFYGLASHPWEKRNALEAVVQCQAFEP